MGLALGYREFTSSLTKIDYMSFVIWNFFYCKKASTNLHAALQVQVAAFLQLFLVEKSGVVGGSQGVVTS